MRTLSPSRPQHTVDEGILFYSGIGSSIKASTILTPFSLSLLYIYGQCQPLGKQQIPEQKKDLLEGFLVKFVFVPKPLKLTSTRYTEQSNTYYTSN